MEEPINGIPLHIQLKGEASCVKFAHLTMDSNSVKIAIKGMYVYRKGSVGNRVGSEVVCQDRVYKRGEGGGETPCVLPLSIPIHTAMYDYSHIPAPFVGSSTAVLLIISIFTSTLEHACLER